MNLIPDVRQQLQQSRRVSRPHLLRVATAATVLLVFFSVAVVVALYQQEHDPGLSSVDTQGLYTELNLSQTIHDVTVTLQRGYADAHRIALVTQVRYDEAVAAHPEGGFNIIYRLVDATSGEVLPEIPFGSGSGGGGENTTVREMTRELSFDATGIDAEAGALDLRLEMRFTANEALGGSGGGGGGGGAPAAAPSPRVVATPVPAEQFEPFTVAFDFSLPFLPAYQVPAETLPVVNGLEMRIEQISITPSLTIVDLCYALPAETDRLWGPVLAVITEEGEYGKDAPPPLETPVTEDEICQSIRMSVPYVPGTDATWRLEVQYLRSTFAATQRNAEQFQAFLAEQGLEVDVFSAALDGAQTFNLAMGVRTPPEFEGSVSALLAEAYATLGQRIDGPWTLTFDVP